MSLLSDDVRLVPLVDQMDDPAHTPVLYAFELRRDPDPVLHRAPAPGRSEDAKSSAQEVIARIVTVRIDDDTGHLWRQRPPRELVASIDIRRGQVRPASWASEEQRDPELLDWLVEHLAEPRLRGLYLARRRQVRAQEGAGLRAQLEWVGWCTGDLVPWSLLTPLEEDGLHWDDDRPYLTGVSCCITPGFTCQQVSVEVDRVTRHRPEALGRCVVDLQREEVELDLGDPAAVGLVERWVARPGCIEMLRERWQRAAAEGRSLLRGAAGGGRKAPGGTRRGRGASPDTVCKAGARAAEALADHVNEAWGRHVWDAAWFTEFHTFGAASQPGPEHPATQVFMGWLFYHRLDDEGQTLAERYLESARPGGLLGRYLRAAQATPFSVYCVVSIDGEEVQVEDVLAPGPPIVVHDPEGAEVLEPGEWILTMVVQLPEGAAFEGACPLPLSPQHHEALDEQFDELEIDHWTRLERLADSFAIIEAFGAVSGWMEQDEDDWDEEDDDEDDDDDWDEAGDDEDWDQDDGDEADDDLAGAALVERLLAEAARVRHRPTPERLRRAVLRQGEAMVEPLIMLLQQERYRKVDGPGGGWAPLHAASLLGKLGDAAAVGPLLELLARTTPEDLAHDRAVLALLRLGAEVVLEPALSALAGLDPVAPESAPLLLVLSLLEAEDERIYGALRAHLELAPSFAAGCLASYGDPRALGPIGRLIDAYRIDPDPVRPHVDQDLVLLCEAFEELGGELSERQLQKLDLVEVLRDEVLEERKPAGVGPGLRGPLELAEPVAPRRKVERPGRNQPCWCGSGKKYKKCHLPTDEA